MPCCRSWLSTDWEFAFLPCSISVDFEYGQKGFLRNVDPAHTLHPLLSFLLFFQELSLARDISSITFGNDVLFHGPYRFTSNDLASDGGLYGDFEELARNQLFHLLNERAAAGVSLISMNNNGKSVHRLP